MLNALTLSAVTGLTAAEIGKLLTEANVPSMKANTFNTQLRKQKDGGDPVELLTDDEAQQLRSYVSTEATALARVANNVWGRLEKWFADDSPLGKLPEKGTESTTDDFDFGAELDNSTADPFAASDDDGFGDDNEDTGDFGLDGNNDIGGFEEFDEPVNEPAHKDPDNPDDILDELFAEENGLGDTSDLDDLGVADDSEDPMDALFKNTSNQPTDYDRSALEVDAAAGVFPDTEATMPTPEAQETAEQPADDDDFGGLFG